MNHERFTAEFITFITERETLLNSRLEWKNTEPGVLALIGTRFRIEYAIRHDGYNFHLYDGIRLCGRHPALQCVKEAAVSMQAELQEMGVE